MKKVYLVRHGQTVGNVGKIFQDESTPLTEQGHAQAQVTGARLAHLELDALVASPFHRAQQTAQHIAEATGLSVDTFDSFHESLQPLHLRGFSKVEGEGLEYVRTYPERYIQDEVFAEGFENFALVIKRAQLCAEFLRNHTSDNIVVVSHSAFIHVLSSFLLMQEKVDKEVGVPLSRSLDNMTNAGITEFVFDEKWKLVTWNDTAHFAE